jgi:DNA-binding beta-propeller fold protein YncE
VSIAVNTQGDVYVTDETSHCIQKFDSTGKFLSIVGELADTDLPVGIALDAQGNAFVTDNQIGVIWKFDSAGNLLATWNSADPDYGRFDAPGGIVVDGQGNVYVVEVAGERIRKFAQP